VRDFDARTDRRVDGVLGTLLGRTGPEAEGWYVFHSVSHVQRNRQISLAD
jgi:hypothetical protein